MATVQVQSIALMTDEESLPGTTTKHLNIYSPSAYLNGPGRLSLLEIVHLGRMVAPMSWTSILLSITKQVADLSPFIVSRHLLAPAGAGAAYYLLFLQFLLEPPNILPNYYAEAKKNLW